MQDCDDDAELLVLLALDLMKLVVQTMNNVGC